MEEQAKTEALAGQVAAAQENSSPALDIQGKGFHIVLSKKALSKIRPWLPYILVGLLAGGGMDGMKKAWGFFVGGGHEQIEHRISAIEADVKDIKADLKAVVKKLGIHRDR